MASRPLSLVLGFASAGAFAAFPLLRPWGDKTGEEWAMVDAFASPGWIIAHSSGMFAWALLAATLVTLAGDDRWLRKPAWAAAVGAAAVLPYYGAETFGLHGLATTALADGEIDFAATAQETIRSEALATTYFGLGLLAIAAAGVGVAVSTWRRSTNRRWIGIPVGLGLITYLPQFFAPNLARQAHGLTLALALALWLLLRDDSPAEPGTADPAKDSVPRQRRTATSI